MRATQAIQHAATVTVTLDQSGEPQLGQVLAGHGGPATRDPGQARDVELLVAQRPQHPHPGRIRQQDEGQRGGVDLFIGQRIRMLLRG